MIDVYVLGHGIPELAAALECAEVGLSVRIAPGAVEPVRAAARSGHAHESGVPARAAFDPERVYDPDGTLRAFLEHVAAPITAGGAPTPEAAPLATPPQPVLLRGARGAAVPQPTPAVFGIPAVPLSQASIGVLGGAGAARAFVDRVRPILTIGKTQQLGALVRVRLGQPALRGLVEPFIAEKYGVPASDVDVAIAAPGLNEDVTTAGSLCGAALEYSDRHVARETTVHPRDGWDALREALLDRLALYGADIADASVVALHEGADAWGVVESAAPGATAVTERREARAVIVGDAGAAALPVSAADEPPASAHRWVVEFTVEAPEWSTAVDEAAPASAPDATRADLLELAPDDLGDLWALRWRPPAPGRPDWLVRASGPTRASYAEHHSDGNDGNDARDPNATAAERTAVATAASALERVGGTRLSGSSVNALRVAAPYPSRAARDSDRSHTMSLRDAKSTCLRAGTSGHSGDLAAAVHDAREEAVRLRRQLTDIAD